MAGLGIVDWPAYSKSVIEVRAADFLAEFDGPVEYRQMPFSATFAITTSLKLSATQGGGARNWYALAHSISLCKTRRAKFC